MILPAAGQAPYGRRRIVESYVFDEIGARRWFVTIVLNVDKYEIKRIEIGFTEHSQDAKVVVLYKTMPDSIIKVSNASLIVVPLLQKLQQCVYLQKRSFIQKKHLKVEKP